MEGDILKYIPTSTVGKVLDVRERDGRAWARLDRTGLYYDAEYLRPADKSEYIEVSFKERERGPAGREGAEAAIEELRRTEEEVDIRRFTPSGGG